MLVDNLFEIHKLEASNDSLTAAVKIDATSEIFDGHFPDNPVTPGVLQVQLVKEILEKKFDKRLKLISMSRCKFLSIWNPINTPEIRVEIKVVEQDSGVKVSAIGKSEETSYFKFSASYRNEI